MHSTSRPTTQRTRHPGCPARCRAPTCGVPKKTMPWGLVPLLPAARQRCCWKARLGAQSDSGGRGSLGPTSTLHGAELHRVPWRMEALHSSIMQPLAPVPACRPEPPYMPPTTPQSRPVTPLQRLKIIGTKCIALQACPGIRRWVAGSAEGGVHVGSDLAPGRSDLGVPATAPGRSAPRMDAVPKSQLLVPRQEQSVPAWAVQTTCPTRDHTRTADVLGSGRQWSAGRMAATAQNHMEPLRSGDGKKDEDHEEECTSRSGLLCCLDRAFARHPRYLLPLAPQWSTPRSMGSRRAPCCRRPVFSTRPTPIPGDVSRSSQSCFISSRRARP